MSWFLFYGYYQTFICCVREVEEDNLVEIGIGQYKVSSRTLKKVLALGLVMITMEIIGQGDSGSMIAGMSAIILLREGVTPHRAATGRIIGQVTGAICSLIYFFVYDTFGKYFVIKLFLVLFFVIAITLILNRVHLESGIFGGITTLLIIVFMIPDGSALSYCLLRIFDSFIGILIAIIVNSFWLEKELTIIEERIDHAIDKVKRKE